MDALAHFDTWQLVALAATLGLASGLRLYAVLFIVGAAGYMGWVELPSGLATLAHPAVLAASGFMCFVEFFADKVPGVDSLWDVVHTLIRIPAGAALAAGVFGDSSSAMMLAAAILGGTLAAGSHFTKASSRAVINTSPEPFSNWARRSPKMSPSAACSGSHRPSAGGSIVVVIMIVLMIWLLPKAWRGARRIVARLGSWFGYDGPKSGDASR